MAFFKEEKKHAKITEAQGLCMVLLEHRDTPDKQPLSTLIEHGSNDETIVHLSPNQFLERRSGLGGDWTTEHLKLSLAIVPLQLLELNGQTLFSKHPPTPPGSPKVFLDTLSSENIVFSVIGNKDLKLKDFLTKGQLKINPYHEDFINHLIKSSTENPLELLIGQFCPETWRRGNQSNLPENQKAYQNFINSLRQFDAQQQHALLDLLNLGLNPAAKQLIADEKQLKSDRPKRSEIEYQLNQTFHESLSAPTKKEADVKKTISHIIEYVGSNIPGYSKDLQQGLDADEPESIESAPRGPSR